MEIAQQLVQHLIQRHKRVVFAESCTGGMVACELAKIPGVSEYLCGSAVTYRCDTKVRWLGVDEVDLEKQTAVSHCVAVQMAHGVLERTPEASLAASVTGHLGPDAPPGFDGVVFVGTAVRQPDGTLVADATRFTLTTAQRGTRQIEATELVLAAVLAKLK